VGHKCHPSRPPIPEEREVNRLHAEAVKKRKEAVEAAADRKRRRKGKPLPVTPESTSEEEEDTSNAEAHLPGDGEAATGADSPPVYQEAGDEDAPAAPREVRPAPGLLADPPLAGTEWRSPTPVAGQRSPTPVAGQRSADHLRPRQSGGRPCQRRARGGRACDVDRRRSVRGERGDARTDSLEASGGFEDDTLRSVVEGRQRAAGPKEWHG
jgi:hypothetical protein